MSAHPGRTQLLRNLSGPLEVDASDRGRSADGAEPDLLFEVINLDRRPERLAAFTTMAAARDPELAARCTRRAGVDGEALEATPEIIEWIDGNTYDSGRGVVGCALSHLGAWRDAASRRDQVTVVLEDDVTVAPGFASTAAQVVRTANRHLPGWHVLFFGCTLRGPRDDESAKLTLKRVRWNYYAGGLFAYAVSSTGAATLASVVEGGRLTEGIDCMLKIGHRAIRGYEVVPHVAWASVAGLHRPGVATDVQRDTGSLLK